MMITRLFLPILALAACGLTNTATAADDSHHKKPATAAAGKGHLVAVTDKDPAWLAKARADYPVSVCVVSDEKFGGSMGEPSDFIYREEGKPDRLVRFCCDDCSKDFNEDPAKYLAAIDTAIAAKGKRGK